MTMTEQISFENTIVKSSVKTIWAIAVAVIVGVFCAAGVFFGIKWQISDIKKDMISEFRNLRLEQMNIDTKQDSEINLIKNNVSNLTGSVARLEK